MENPINIRETSTSTTPMTPKMPGAMNNSIPGSAPKKKVPLQMVIGAAVLLLLVVGGAVAFLLSNRNQEIRQQASGGTITYIAAGPGNTCPSGFKGVTIGPIFQCMGSYQPPATTPPSCTGLSNTACGGQSGCQWCARSAACFSSSVSCPQVTAVFCKDGDTQCSATGFTDLCINSNWSHTTVACNATCASIGQCIGGNQCTQQDIINHTSSPTGGACGSVSCNISDSTTCGKTSGCQWCARSAACFSSGVSCPVVLTTGCNAVGLCLNGKLCLPSDVQANLSSGTGATCTNASSCTSTDPTTCGKTSGCQWCARSAACFSSSVTCPVVTTTCTAIDQCLNGKTCLGADVALHSFSPTGPACSTTPVTSIACGSPSAAQVSSCTGGTSLQCNTTTGQWSCSSAPITSVACGSPSAAQVSSCPSTTGSLSCNTTTGQWTCGPVCNPGDTRCATDGNQDICINNSWSHTTIACAGITCTTLGQCLNGKTCTQLDLIDHTSSPTGAACSTSSCGNPGDTQCGSNGMQDICINSVWSHTTIACTPYCVSSGQCLSGHVCTGADANNHSTTASGIACGASASTCATGTKPCNGVCIPSGQVCTSSGTCQGPLQSCETGSCCSGYVCQGVTGSRVCQQQQSVCQSTETCGGNGGYIGFKCSNLTNGQCLNNPAYFNSFGEAVAYAGTCGQADQVCSSNHNLCGSFAIMSSGCGGSTPGTPGVSPRPGVTPSPIGPVCLNIAMSSLSPVIGDTVTFTCGTVAGVNHYEFQVKAPDGTVSSLAGGNGQPNVSAGMKITQSGAYQAECRICTGAAASTCQQYGSF